MQCKLLQLNTPRRLTHKFRHVYGLPAVVTDITQYSYKMKW